MALPLESFEAFTEDPVLPTGPSQDYLLGLADGEAAAAARLEQSQATLSAEAVAALQDLAFGYAEARRHVLDALRPLLDQIAQRIVPITLRDGFATELAGQLAALAEDDSNLPLSISLAPANAARLRPLLAQVMGIPITVIEDASLGTGEAHWSTPKAETALDLEKLADGLRLAIEALTDQEQRNRRHG